MTINNPKSDEIVEAASLLFSQKGYPATSLREIADRVGLHKTSLFHYFKNKEEILTEVMDRAIEEYINILNDDEIFSLNLSSDEKLRIALERQVQIICKYKDYINVYLNEIKNLSPENKPKYDAKRKQYGNNFEKLIKEIQKDPNSDLFKGLNAKAVTVAILGMCNWIIKWYSPGGELNPKDISEIFFSIITRKLS